MHSIRSIGGRGHEKLTLLPPALAAFATASLLAGSSLPASAQDGAVPAKPNCAPPELVNSVAMERVPDSDLMTVTANIEGSPKGS